MRLNRREIRTIALGAVAAAGILLYWSLTTPSGTDAPDERPQLEGLYARYRAVAADSTAIRAALTHTRAQRSALDAALLRERHPSLAGAELSDQLVAMAARQGLDVQRTLLEPAGVADRALQSIPVQLSASGDVYGLHGLLYEIETAPLTLSIDRLHVAALGDPAGRRRTGARPPLQIRITVTGYAFPYTESGTE